jgi:hypothetical protein
MKKVKQENKRKRIRLIKTNKKANKKIKIKPISTINIKYDDRTNYFVEYWKIYVENEYSLAKIKETVYEIENMRSHLDMLNKANVNKEN